MLRWHQNG
jgi:RimJ/RimL family protein N-acetyltransferase